LIFGFRFYAVLGSLDRIIQEGINGQRVILDIRFDRMCNLGFGRETGSAAAGSVPATTGRPDV
jgi:hypothetical protein